MKFQNVLYSAYNIPTYQSFFMVNVQMILSLAAVEYKLDFDCYIKMRNTKNMNKIEA